jgi:ubiquinone/menaquinone biosynthesis C-methylase UbiE
MVNYNQEPLQRIKGKNKEISIFITEGKNIDEDVVKSFGDEWQKFHVFSDAMIEEWVEDYFDIINETIVNENTYMLDIGCGSGRWTKHFSKKVRFIEAVDPSNSIFAADNLLGTISNVRLSKASIENIPFPDKTFDFVMSVGVLHHTPNTQMSMIDCVKKVKPGGHFYCYLYHNLENMRAGKKILFYFGEIIRKTVSRLPRRIKAFTCDVLAIVVYMPFILMTRFLFKIGLNKLAEKVPLSCYHDKSFFSIRNDSLDKFGTRLEHRFSRKEVEQLMINCGLSEIVISDRIPHYHAVGKRK